MKSILDLIKISEDSNNFILLSQLTLAREWFWASLLESKNKDFKNVEIRIKNVICEKCKKILTDDFDCSCLVEVATLKAGKGRKQCTNCENYVGPRTLICGYCGFNFKTNKLEIVYKKRETLKKATKNTKKKKAVYIPFGNVKSLEVLIDNDMVEENILLFRNHSSLTEEQNSAIESYLEWRNTLIEENRALAIGMARQIFHSMVRKNSISHITCEDLEQSAIIGLIKGITHFDIKRTWHDRSDGKDKLIKFSTYATEWIRREIIEEIITKDKDIKVPHHIINRYKSFRNYYLNYLEKCGYEPELENIVEDLKVTEKIAMGLLVLKDMRQFRSISVEETMDKYKNESSGEDIKINKNDANLLSKLSEETIENCEFDFLKYIDEIEFAKDIYKEIFLNYFGFNQERKQWTPDELQKEYSVSKQTISTHINAAIEQLKDVFIN